MVRLLNELEVENTRKKLAWLQAKYEEVRQSIQHGMDVLARRRAFPIFG